MFNEQLLGFIVYPGTLSVAYIVAFIVTKACVWGTHMDFGGDVPSEISFKLNLAMFHLTLTPCFESLLRGTNTLARCNALYEKDVQFLSQKQYIQQTYELREVVRFFIYSSFVYSDVVCYMDNARIAKNCNFSLHGLQRFHLSNLFEFASFRRAHAPLSWKFNWCFYGVLFGIALNQSDQRSNAYFECAKMFINGIFSIILSYGYQRKIIVVITGGELETTRFGCPFSSDALPLS